ncbi:hypothetical protein CBFG_03887 [Clostridiales bacterium 1_7_47FAA]|nr:hypothetical protein CBFG_03887 [Clostridiales bacterium 1_7_47FAA]
MQIKEGQAMHKIAESMHYEVYREYETVLLKMKHLERTVTIGDFYGDVGKVIISPKEECCVMAGCGVIVYYLNEPFTPYGYDKRCGQWKEWYRAGDTWVEDVVLENDGTIVIQLENGEKTALPCLPQEEGRI